MDSINSLTVKGVKNLYQELKSQFLEMAQLKSNFDIEKFTVRKEGTFIAHNFHFLMRQYSLTLYELRRILIDCEERARTLERYENLLSNGQKKVDVWTDRGKEEKYVDLEIERLKNENDLQELSLKDRYERCQHFEKCRQELIELNGGTAPTNEQQQAEEPEYWKWFLKRAAIMQARQRKTGISEGVYMNIENLEQPPMLNPDFQVMMLDDLGNLDLGSANVENEKRKGLLDRVENIMGIQLKLEDSYAWTTHNQNH
jgi:hypothetical protein